MGKTLGMTLWAVKNVTYYERIITLSCKLKYNCRKAKIDKFF